MKYRTGFKYQLAETIRICLSDYHMPLPLLERGIEEEFHSLEWEDGRLWLTLRSGYACDGPSGPTYDTRNSMLGAFVHDGLYQFIRLGRLGPWWRTVADILFRKICIAEGMQRWRAWIWFWGVKYFAEWAVDPGAERTVIDTEPTPLKLQSRSKRHE